MMNRNANWMKKTPAWLLAVCLLAGALLAGCRAAVPAEEAATPPAGAETPTPAPEAPQNGPLTLSVASAVQIENLHMLAKVWGFVKYHHPVFQGGERDWDEALFEGLPAVLQAENAEQCNEALATWVEALGPAEPAKDELSLAWRSFPAESQRVLADSGWMADEGVIGARLCAALSGILEAAAVGTEQSPVYFTNSFTTFTGEKAYPDMDYADARYRLLGLFRMYNAVEYYFPYKDIMEEDWDACLMAYIPKMLGGTDKRSYELTLAEMSTRLHDAHVGLADKSVLVEEFGAYLAPARLTKAEGRFVVRELYKGHEESCPLLPGDVLLKLDGRELDEVVAERLRYTAVSNEEKLLRKLAPFLLRSHNEVMNITVERDGGELTLAVTGYTQLDEDTGLISHALLDNGIGLINPAALEKDEVHSFMPDFLDTKGLIIDLRQYPSDYVVYSLAQYLMPEPTPFVVFSFANQAVPGAFVSMPPVSSGEANPAYYKNKVAILMDETSISQSEFTIMSLRNAPRAAVIGTNSIGADGDITELPLPGGNSMIFTGLGVYTAEGGGTQRVGLPPDIRVERTIAGVREGRDELMEAAVKYILE